MKLKVFLGIILLGCLTVTEGRFPKLKLDPNAKIEDPVLAAKLNAQMEDVIQEKWQIHATEDEGDETVFTASSFNTRGTRGTDIRGKIMYTLEQNRKIYAYQGFRYGTAERFSPPKDVNKFWDGNTFNATHIGLKCPQGAYVGHQPAGDEDCLYLNVYTPYHPDDVEGSLSVMVFVYGGSFTSGDSSLYMPTKLLDHDVILVTIHYRLGAFGFYTRDSPKAPGNLAFYDMISALRWVQEHITDFGGNKTEVTVFGESAGSVSVNYLMLLTDDEDENLFRGVIAESGSALEHWALDDDWHYATNFYDEYVGCNYTMYDGETKDDFDDRVLECLRKVPFEEFVHATRTMVSNDRKNGLIGFRGCSPTIQTFNNTLTVKKILYQEPRDYFVNGDFRDTAFMTGSNREEGSFVIGIMYYDYLVPNNLADSEDYLRNEMLRDLLLSVGIKDEPQSIAKSLQKHYCKDVDLANLTLSQYCLTDICGIMFLKAGSWQMANYHSYYSKKYPNNTFYYSFEFESDDSMGAWVINNDSPFFPGITHADELMYLFAMPAIMDEDNGQADMYKRMTLLWTNFARYLDPTPDDHKDEWVALDIPKWTPFVFGDPHFMIFDKTFVVGNDYADRWGITEYEQLEMKYEPAEDECTGKCQDYKDQRDAFEITMIVFIVAFFIACLVAIYFFFKARR